MRSREHAIKRLGEYLRVDSSPEGLIEVRVDDRNRQRAADIANAFVELLDRYNRESSVAQAKRTSEYVRSCLDESRQRMEKAALDLRRFQEEHSTVELTEQIRVTVEAIAGLESQRAQLEIQKGVLRNYTRPGQMRVQEIDANLREIQSKIDRLHGRDMDNLALPEDMTAGSVLLPLSRIPGLGLQLADLTREVVVQEKVYEFLTSQLEEARIQESRDLQTIRFLDEAVPPLKKSRPKRSLIVILTVLLAFLFSITLSFAAEGFLEYIGGDSRKSEMTTRESRTILRVFLWLRKWGGPEEAVRGSSLSSGD